MTAATGGLSQQDIDSLLQNTAAPAAPAAAPAEVLAYDFRRPRRIAKERLRTIESIYGRFAIAVQALFASRLREPVDVTIEGVEQALFSEFVLSLPSPCAAIVFELGAAAGGHGVLDIGNDFSLHLVDRLFGGPGESAELHRTLTALEQMAVTSIVDRILVLFADAWQDHIAFKPAQAGLESVPDALQIAQREEHVLVATFNVRAGQLTATLVLGLPLRVLESFLTEGPAKASSVSARRSDAVSHRAEIEATVRGARLPVVVRLPLFLLTAREVAALDVRRIVMTGRLVGEPVEIHVCGRRRFLGLPGRTRQALGVRVTETFVDAPDDPARAAPRGRLL